MDVLHAQFPWKARQQVVNLYVDIMVEMFQGQEMHTISPMAAGVNLVNDNFGMPVVDPTMHNKDVVLGPVNVVDTRVGKMVEKQPPRRLPTHQPQRHTRTGRFWSTEEHRS